jgi:hypothetical protein
LLSNFLNPIEHDDTLGVGVGRLDEDETVAIWRDTVRSMRIHIAPVHVAEKLKRLRIRVIRSRLDTDASSALPNPRSTHEH